MNTLIELAILIAQIVIIWILLRRIDKPDLSKEDAAVKDSTARANSATEAMNAAIKNLPPQNK